MYIVLAILAFGILIAIHELGHFLAAKACGVRVNEYSIGMGPAIFKKQGKETLYALRVFPIGGYCAMEGEDEESDDPRSFTAQSAWKRVIILAAGAFMNFLLGLVIVILLYSGAKSFAGSTITSLADGFPDDGEAGLMAGDTIYSVDGERVYYSADFTTLMSRDGDGYVDIVVIRGGEKVALSRYNLVQREYDNGDGTVTLRYGISLNLIKANVWERLKFSLYSAFNFVRLIRFGLHDLITGAVGIKELSGPVGIVSAMNDVGRSATTASAGLLNVLYLVAFIAVNLAVMNMLPLPALDGGRIFFLIITWIIEKITRKDINPKYEGYIHTAGLVILMGLMVFVMFNDVVRIIRGQ